MHAVQAARVYSYARRVWHRPNDGGCYMICRATKLPGRKLAPPRMHAFKMQQHVSACSAAPDMRVAQASSTSF